MVMPACGTFYYSGIVPDATAHRASGHWRLADQTGTDDAASLAWWELWKRASRRGDAIDPLRDNRLVGLTPTLRFSDGCLVLEAQSRHRSQLRSATLELDRSILECLQGGDVLTLVRTERAGIGLSVLRSGQLALAAGAVTVVPLAEDIAVRAVDRGPIGAERRPRRDAWIDVSVGSEIRRLRGGEAAALGEYKVSAVRCSEDGMPGTDESLAISRTDLCPHAAVVRSAELLARFNAGLTMMDWA